MSGIKFTTEQETAISLRDRNLLVSASAGTGKTAVLVERIIRMATDEERPVDLDRMLIVTFTNAASEEMKDRIRRALYKEIKVKPGNEKLRRQLILLNNANISTIHAFCSEIIRSNYHLIDIDPGFSVCDSNEAGRFLGEAVSKVLEGAYEKESKAFKMLVESYGRGRDDEHLKELLIKIYNKIRSMPSYRDWLVEKSRLFRMDNDDFGGNQWGRLILDYSATRINGYISEITGLMELISKEETLIGYFKTLSEDKLVLERLYEVLHKDKWDACSLHVKKTDFNKLINAKKGAAEYLKNLVKDTRKDYKDEVKKIKERLSGDSREIYDNFKDLSPMIEEFSELLLLIDSEYRNIKNDNGMVDYGDLEHYALECLESKAGAMYRDRFDEIFVDEYQDSNQIQESIINLVAGRNRSEKNIFMVGDVKQSIYKFRQAEPSIFVSKYETYSEDVEADEVRVELSRNYRSRKPVLDFTNYVFSKIMSQTMGDLNYDKKVFLEQGKEYPKGNDGGYPVEIKLVCGEDKELFTKDIKSNSKEAAVVGGEIFRIIESGMLINDKSTGEERTVRYGDITILNRSANAVSAEYIRQLKKMGIPVYSESDSDFFKEREIIIMRSFLEVIDNPRRDIPLLSLLRSSIFGFTDKELALIRCGTRKERFFDSMKAFSSNKALCLKISMFMDVVERYRRDSYVKPMHRLIWTIMHETGFYNQCLPGDNPDIRKQNLRKLFEIAGRYEKGRETGLFAFIKYLDNLSETGTSEGRKVQDGAGNSVRLMSVHKSKGLEFPVVILSGCGKTFNKAEISENLIFDRDFGFGPDYIDSEAGYKIVTAVKKSLKIKKDIEGLAEEMRVLYVALTRAREKLVITGYVRNIDKSPGKWLLRGRTENGIIDAGKVMLASGCLDWIMSSIINHKNCRRIFGESPMHTDDSDSAALDFNLDIINPNEIQDLLDMKTRSTEEEVNEGDISFEEISQRFNWTYPYIAEGLFHKKVSVTEIKKIREAKIGEKDIFGTTFVPRPGFMADNGKLGAADRGTMLHNVIAAADIQRVFEPGYISNLFRTIGAPKEDIYEFTESLMDFYKSSLGRRLASAAKIETEKAFLFPVLTKELYPDNPLLPKENHTTLVQGVIDCMFYEYDGIVIIDYKSDTVMPGNEKAHAQRYSLQLEMYAKAVGGLTGIPVKEKYIYFLKNRCEVLVP